MIIKFTEKRPNGVPEKFLNLGFYKAEAVGTLMNKSVVRIGFHSYTTHLSFSLKNSTLLTFALLTAPSTLLRQTLKLFTAGKAGSLINQFVKSH